MESKKDFLSVSQIVSEESYEEFVKCANINKEIFRNVLKRLEKY